MAKNTGKTTCLNYVLQRLASENIKLGVTSIGVDGEDRDVLYDTAKPHISLNVGDYFITSEQHFAERKLAARVISVNDDMTALGKLIIAQAESNGEVVLSGPSGAVALRRYIDILHSLGSEIVLVDGALSRMSLASPTITDATILCTGAACSKHLDELVRKVSYLCDTMNFERVSETLRSACYNELSGVWLVNASEKDRLYETLFSKNLEIRTIISKLRDVRCAFLYVSGALTDSFLKELTASMFGNAISVHIIVRDFSKVFANAATYYKFKRRGGEIYVLDKPQLLAICSNPTSPEGYNFDAEELRSSLERALHTNVYDIYKQRVTIL
jgi:hypothetical protein